MGPARDLKFNRFVFFTGPVYASKVGPTLTRFRAREKLTSLHRARRIFAEKLKGIDRDASIGSIKTLLENYSSTWPWKSRWQIFFDGARKCNYTPQRNLYQRNNDISRRWKRGNGRDTRAILFIRRVLDCRSRQIPLFPTEIEFNVSCVPVHFNGATIDSRRFQLPPPPIPTERTCTRERGFTRNYNARRTFCGIRFKPSWM